MTKRSYSAQKAAMSKEAHDAQAGAIRTRSTVSQDGEALHYESADAQFLRTVIGKDSQPLRTQKAQLTQQKLLDAGAVIFARDGYEATRVADIAALAGVAHGSFYRYFDDKDSILQELLLRLYAELGKATRAPLPPEAVASSPTASATSATNDSSGSNPGESPLPAMVQLEAFNVRFFHEYALRRGLLRVAREAAASAGAGCFRDIWFVMRGRFIDRTQRLIERLQRSGHALGLDPELTAEALGAMTEQMAYVLVGLARELPDDARLTAIGKTCNVVWERTLFPGCNR